MIEHDCNRYILPFDVVTNDDVLDMFRDPNPSANDEAEDKA